MLYAACNRPWTVRVDPFRIVGNVYYVGNADVSSHLIDTGDGLLLIDTAYPQTVYLLLESVRRLGFDPDQIVGILHSHAHYDHMGGTRAIVELTGAKTYLGTQDVEFVERRPELTWTPEYGAEFYEAFHTDVPLRDGDVVRRGNAAIRCVHTPGHTPGAMSFFYDVQEDGRRLRVGMHGGPGTNPLTDSYLAKYGLPEQARATFLASIERLRQEQVDVFLGIHPHQSATIEKAKRLRADGPNPFIDPAAWPAFLKSVEEEAEREFGAR